MDAVRASSNLRGAPALALAAATLLVLAADARPGLGPLRIRATEAAAPCAAAAARAHERSSGRRVIVETGALGEAGTADVLVAASAVEMTRALEGGAAAAGTEVDVARIPWVLSVAPGNPLGLRGLADLDRPGLEVWVLGGPAAYEARRSLAAHREDRVHEARDGRVLRGAPVALVPVSLAGSGERLSVDLPPLVAQAALAAQAANTEAGRAFLRFLSSEAGQQAFAACGASSP